MRLRPLKIGRCKVEVTSSNGLKPKIRKTANGQLEIQALCVCGEPSGTFRLDDMSPQIIENALEEKRELESKGKPLRIGMDGFSDLDVDCSCGRVFHVSVHWVLDSAWLKQLNQKRQHAKETLLYGDVLQISVEVKGGFFRETRQVRLLNELLTPICACNTEISPIALKESVNEMIEAINRFWREGVVPQPKTLKLKEKCRFCLHTVKITAKLTPILPSKTNSIPQIVEKFEAWQKRALT